MQLFIYCVLQTQTMKRGLIVLSRLLPVMIKVEHLASSFLVEAVQLEPKRTYNIDGVQLTVEWPATRSPYKF